MPASAITRAVLNTRRAAEGAQRRLANVQSLPAGPCTRITWTDSDGVYAHKHRRALNTLERARAGDAHLGKPREEGAVACSPSRLNAKRHARAAAAPRYSSS